MEAIRGQDGMRARQMKKPEAFPLPVFNLSAKPKGFAERGDSTLLRALACGDARTLAG